MQVAGKIYRETEEEMEQRKRKKRKQQRRKLQRFLATVVRKSREERQKGPVCILQGMRPLGLRVP